METSPSNPARARTVRLVAALVVACSALSVASDAGADSISCEPFGGPSSQAWNRADAVVTAFVSEPQNPGYLMFRDRRTTVVGAKVDEVLKGEAPTELDIFLGACGPALPTDRLVTIALGRDEAGDYGFVDLLTDAQAASLGGEPPPADGVGPVRSIVSVDAGAIDLVALDGDGRALGFRAGTAPPLELAVCPEGRTVVAWANDPSRPPGTNPSIDVIDVATMTTTGTMHLPRSAPVEFLACHDPAGSQVTAFIQTSPEGGSLVRFGSGPAVVTAVQSRPPFGLDDRGNVVAWTNVFTSEVIVTDPTTGATVSKHLMPDLHGYLPESMPRDTPSVFLVDEDRARRALDDDGRFASLSADRRQVAVLAYEIPEESWNSPVPTLVIHDLVGGAPPRIVEIGTVEVPWRIDWVGEDVALTFADGDRRSGVAPDDDVVARRVVVPVGTVADPDAPPSEPSAPVPPAIPVLDGAEDRTDPVAAATEVGLVPIVLGEPVSATVAVPGSPEVVVGPGAAQPDLAQTSVPNGGRPFPVPPDYSWMATVAVLGVLGLAIVVSWHLRQVRTDRAEPWLRW